MSSSFPTSRTTIEIRSAWTTSALSQIGLAGTSCTITGEPMDWAFAKSGQNAPKSARARKAATLLDFFIEGNFQRFQKLDVLGRNFELRLRAVLFQNIFVHANVQRFEKSAILLGHARVLSLTPSEADRGVELQHDVESGRAHVRNRLGDAVRFRNAVVDCVSQVAQQLLHAVVELQGPTSV